MNYRNKLYMMAAVAAGLTFTGCDDFLDRPIEDGYSANTFYQNDAQLKQATNVLYGSPWYDFQRGFFKVGEVLSGNYYWGDSPYLTFTVNSSDQDNRNMSASLWSVNGYCNVTIENINNYAGSACTEAGIRTAKGEALTWKAMAYFFLVRSYGGVPIIHDNSKMMQDGNYNDVYRAKPENVYEYIVKTLEKAIELLPEKCEKGRLDKYCAKGLLAKVYLTKAGVTGTLNNEDLQKAVEYAKDVKDNSGRSLMPVYSDIFRLANNMCDESLIAWRWTAEGNNWTRQNSLQSDLGMQGMNELGDSWGGWAGPSVDLIKAFGDDPLKKDRNNVDTRRKATCMMAGDKYDYFWTDHGGFDVLDFFYNEDKDVLASRNNKTGGGSWTSSTGAQSVKHIVGDNADHIAGIGYGMTTMCTSLATHILRLADVYLVLAEAQTLLDGGTTTDADALDAYNKVYLRACPSKSSATKLTWDLVWKERRLELACEGDRWYDFVRLAYYRPDAAISELTAQLRETYYGLDEVYKPYYETGVWTVDETKTAYNDVNKAPLNINESHFTLPFPDVDLAANPHLTEEPVEVDIDQYSY